MENAFVQIEDSFKISKTEYDIAGKEIPIDEAEASFRFAIGWALKEGYTDDDLLFLKNGTEPLEKQYSNVEVELKSGEYVEVAIYGKREDVFSAFWTYEWWYNGVYMVTINGEQVGIIDGWRAFNYAPGSPYYPETELTDVAFRNYRTSFPLIKALNNEVPPDTTFTFDIYNADGTLAKGNVVVTANPGNFYPSTYVSLPDGEYYLVETAINSTDEAWSASPLTEKIYFSVDNSKFTSGQIVTLDDSAAGLALMAYSRQQVMEFIEKYPYFSSFWTFSNSMLVFNDTVGVQGVEKKWLRMPGQSYEDLSAEIVALCASAEVIGQSFPIEFYGGRVRSEDGTWMEYVDLQDSATVTFTANDGSLSDYPASAYPAMCTFTLTGGASAAARICEWPGTYGQLKFAEKAAEGWLLTLRRLQDWQRFDNTETGSLTLAKAVAGDADPDQEFDFKLFLFSPQSDYSTLYLSAEELDETEQTVLEFLSSFAGVEDWSREWKMNELCPELRLYNMRYSMGLASEAMPLGYLFPEDWDMPYLQISLKAGESVTIPNLPARCIYVVQESDYSADGYVTKARYVVGGLDDVETVATVTNNYLDSKTTHRVEKLWEQPENEPDKSVPVQVQLTAGGKAQGAPVTLNAENEWTHTWTELPMFTESGDAIVYAAEEVAVPAGFTAETETKDGVTTITNSLSVDLTVKKEWNDSNDRDGLRPKSLKVQLLADGEAVSGKTVTLNAANSWSATLKGLPSSKDGKEIAYSWDEGTVSGYSLTGTSVSGKVTTLTNTHAPGTVEISGTKTWDDSNDRYGKRPASITVRLKADGVEVASVKVTAAEGWKYTFKDQPKNNAAGKAIVYTVTEDAVPGYTTRVSGYNLTNTYQPRRFFSPRTGDGNQPMLWLGLALLSGVGVCAEVSRRKRKESKGKR